MNRPPLPAGHPHAFALATVDGARPSLVAVVEQAHKRARGAYLDHFELKHAQIELDAADEAREVEDDIRGMAYKSKGAATRARNRLLRALADRTAYRHRITDEQYAGFSTPRTTLGEPSPTWTGRDGVYHHALIDGTLELTCYRHGVGIVATCVVAAGSLAFQARAFEAFDTLRPVIRLTPP